MSEPCRLECPSGLAAADVVSAVGRFAQALLTTAPRRVLLIPPDYTRSHSGAGWLTRLCYEALTPGTVCDVLPALGSHRPMSRAEQIAFWGTGIPEGRVLTHDWRRDTVEIGRVPAALMAELSNGRMTRDVPVEVNRLLIDGGYDAIISIGQVVPHEVAGMANYTKNILVGCGGHRMIDASHLLSVYAGTEAWMGRDFSPVRLLFDYAQAQYIDALPITYMLTVTTPGAEGAVINGLYIGGGREAFARAVALSQRVNITHTGKPITTCVVCLPQEEFRSAWLGNKAVYRTRKALAEGAVLIILAPGFERFGEDEANDRLIRRYGYIGRARLLELFEEEDAGGALHTGGSALAHLIQGSADERFTIRYCTAPVYEGDIRSVGYDWGDIGTYAARYEGLPAGWNKTPEGEVYVINNPALGLWEV